MDSKKVIEKLAKIVENQQKIITKLAQQVADSQGGWEDVTSTVAGVLAKNPNAKGVGVSSAQVGSQSGKVTVKVKVPMNLLGTPKLKDVMDKLKLELAGKDLGGTVAQDVEVIAET